MRNVSPITVEKKVTRALALDEVRKLRAGLRADERALGRGIPDIVDFMLGTGLRIGEALVVTWEALDLEAATVEVRGTLTYERGTPAG
jgi:integrase